MSAFIKNDITDGGLNALAHALIGEELRFTKIVVGSGYMPSGATPRSMEAVVTPVATLDIVKLKRGSEPGTAIAGGIFTNKDIAAAFPYRELALYAETASTGEVLYCYGNAEDAAELIPPGTSSDVIEKVVDIVAAVGGAANVTAYINLEAYATVRQVEEAIELARDAVARAQAAETNAANAVDMASAAQAAVVGLNTTVQDNAAKIQTLWDALFSDITTNPFTVSFANLAGVTMTAGVWNEALQRVEC